MRIAVVSKQHQIDVLASSVDAEMIHLPSLQTMQDIADCDAVIHLGEESAKLDYQSLHIPVFISSVIHTLQEQGHSQNVVRFNGWEGFYQKSIWELSGTISEQHLNVLKLLKKTYRQVPDICGFISCRIIAMIINEAFFALDSGVSSEKEIDTAMKLGTNYPMGPFEWADMVGREKWHSLLLKLSASDNRYTPCSLLQSKKN